MAFFRIVPNLTIMAPANFKELEDMLEFAVNLGKPVIIRYPRGGEENSNIRKEKIVLGKSQVLEQGEDITIISIGKTVARSLEVAKEIRKKGKTPEVINARFLKPLDRKTIKESIEKTKYVITMEDGTIVNGLATAIKELIVDEKIKNVKIQNYAYPDEYIKHGMPEELEKLYNQDSKSIIANIDFKYIESTKKKTNA